jgi:hypothetical protein
MSNVIDLPKDLVDTLHVKKESAVDDTVTRDDFDRLRKEFSAVTDYVHEQMKATNEIMSKLVDLQSGKKEIPVEVDEHKAHFDQILKEHGLEFLVYNMSKNIDYFMGATQHNIKTLAEKLDVTVHTIPELEMKDDAVTH